MPLRVHVITTASFVGSLSGFLTVKKPDGRSITANDANYNYFVTLSENGSKPYYKKNKYFALVNDPTNNNNFFSWFMDTADTQNSDTISYLKLNPMVQYVRNPFKLPITLDVRDTIVTNNNVTTDVTVPKGIQLNIEDGKWGRQNYNWTEVKNTPYTEYQYVPSLTTNQQIGNNYGTVANHDATLTSDPFNRAIQRTRTEYIPHNESQMKNVKDKEQQITNVNSLRVNPGTYYNQFGDPTYKGQGSGGYNPGLDQLTTSYKWTKIEEKFTEKQLYINERGFLVLDYLYEGVRYTSPINNITYTPNEWNPAQGQCPYKLTLESNPEGTSVRFMIRNNGGVIGSLPIFNQNDPREKRMNENWMYTSQVEIKPGERLIEGRNTLRTADGKFKFSLEAVNATVMYCVKPFNEFKVQSANKDINVTKPNNIDNDKQMLYLYRIRSRGLLGKKFLYEENNALGVKDVYFVPNNHNNILQYKEFKEFAGYPIVSDGYNKDNYVVYQNKSKGECQAECMSNSKCDHYFYVNKAGSNTTGTCNIDVKNNANSIYTTKNPDNRAFGTGTYGVKKDAIISSCEYNNNPDAKINTQEQSTFLDRTVYYQPVQNQPEMTYYCGLSRHQNALKQIQTVYDKKDGFTNIEAFNEKCSNAGCMISNIQNLTPAINSYSTTQDKINDTYNLTQEYLKTNLDLSGNLADPRYKYTDSNAMIPDQFINNPNPQPDTNIIQGQIEDMKHNLLVQNSIFTLAAISAASFLIIAIAIGRS